jgi:hypothetical protein
MRYILVLLISFLVVSAASSCSTHASKGTELRAACPLGTPLYQVLQAVRKEEPTRLILTSPSECQKHWGNQPQTCLGGSRIDATFETGLELRLDVTYLFDESEKLAVAEYNPRITGL